MNDVLLFNFSTWAVGIGFSCVHFGSVHPPPGSDGLLGSGGFQPGLPVFFFFFFFLRRTLASVFSSRIGRVLLNLFFFFFFFGGSTTAGAGVTGGNSGTP